MSKLELKDPEDLAMEIVESGRLTRGAVFILNDRLAILNWAVKAKRREVLTARNACAVAWTEADEKDAAEIEVLMDEQYDKEPGRPRAAR
jgi:hypothetical protein